MEHAPDDVTSKTDLYAWMHQAIGLIAPFLTL